MTAVTPAASAHSRKRRGRINLQKLGRLEHLLPMHLIGLQKDADPCERIRLGKYRMKRSVPPRWRG